MPIHIYSKRLVIAVTLYSCLLVAVACESPAPPPDSTATLPLASPTPSAATTQPPATLPTARPSPTSPETKPTIGATPKRATNLEGHFVFVGVDGELWIEDAGAGNARLFYQVNGNGYVNAPSFSPDGKQIAFTASSFTKDGSTSEEIRITNVDGTNPRVVISSNDPKTSIDYPAWSPDGNALFVTQDSSAQPSNEHVEIDRISVNGGALSKVIDDGREANVSADGKKIVFARYDSKTYAASLWIANSGGSGAKRLVDDGTFATLFGARFSPDGQSIVFAASGPPSRKLPGVQGYMQETPGNEGACAVSIVFICLVETAQAHGLPWDLWLVNPTGTKFERLTNIGADSPVPAWSRDGKQIAFFDATGIYLLDWQKKSIHQVSDSRGYGGFDWR